MYPRGYYYCKGCGSQGPTAETKQGAYAATMYMSFHEMTARELLCIEDRMMDQDEDAFNKYCELTAVRKIEKAVQFAEKWAREHPEGKE